MRTVLRLGKISTYPTASTSTVKWKLIAVIALNASQPGLMEQRVDGMYATSAILAVVQSSLKKENGYTIIFFIKNIVAI